MSHLRKQQSLSAGLYAYFSLIYTRYSRGSSVNAIRTLMNRQQSKTPIVSRRAEFTYSRRLSKTYMTTPANAADLDDKDDDDDREDDNYEDEDGDEDNDDDDEDHVDASSAATAPDVEYARSRRTLVLGYVTAHETNISKLSGVCGKLRPRVSSQTFSRSLLLFLSQRFPAKR
ncbi:hypothetical protein PUN28_002529 [Cardiocondyla obscurior]|uniref:Uncharacterized protein n=1 Tax=Cardiocondyla obscurior TaxID=286306 RepID=A0AAW2GUZ4_9HYME